MMVILVSKSTQFRTRLRTITEVFLNPIGVSRHSECTLTGPKSCRSTIADVHEIPETVCLPHLDYIWDLRIPQIPNVVQVKKNDDKLVLIIWNSILQRIRTRGLQPLYRSFLIAGRRFPIFVSNYQKWMYHHIRVASSWQEEKMHPNNESRRQLSTTLWKQ